MGYVTFLNQDGEWEQFPNEEQQANLRENALLLEELGYKLSASYAISFPIVCKSDSVTSDMNGRAKIVAQ